MKKSDAVKYLNELGHFSKSDYNYTDVLKVMVGFAKKCKKKDKPDSDDLLNLANAQFVGFKHGKWYRHDIVGLVEGMGLSEAEWNKLKKDYPLQLDENDVVEIENYFKSN